MKKATQQHLRYFELLWYVFHHPSASLEELGDWLSVSVSMAKKMIAFLRDHRVLAGRGGNLRTTLQHLRQGLPLASSSAFVYVRLNIPLLRRLKPGRRRALPYSDEDGLLDYIKNVLPLEATDCGRVIVERTFVQMGDPLGACVLLVHGAHEKHIQDFVRKRVEMCPGVVETKTLGITAMT